MHENSKIISFAISASDGLERAYRNSFFFKGAKNLSTAIRNIWRESILGQIIDSAFNVETHRNSISYKLFTKFCIAFMDFINDKLNLEQSIVNSRYINMIKNAGLLNRKTEANEGFLRAIFKDSIFMKSLYQFWEGMD